MYAHLPLTVTVADRGAVTVEAATRVVAMSPFSERARRLAADLGTGTHVVRTSEEASSLTDATFADLTDALA